MSNTQATTHIGWTGKTWNPFLGCDKVNSLCKYCYMFRNETKYGNIPTNIRKTKNMDKPLRELTPTVYFTSSMSDIFHPAIDKDREEIWNVIANSPQHIFQILTKRPGRIKKHLPKDWYSNPQKWAHVWLGTSIGGDVTDRIMVSKLMENYASVLFLSVEPLIGSAEKAVEDFIAYPSFAEKWVIVGGESGNGTIPNDPNVAYGYRECTIEWIKEIVNICEWFAVPVFVKQLGSHLAKKMRCKTPTGTELNEMPESIRVRRFPIDLGKYICNSL